MIDASLDTEYAYCYLEDVDNTIYLGITDSFKKEEHFRFVLMNEMIRLYQYQILNTEPKYGPTFYSFHNSGMKKFKGTMIDPHEDDCEEEGTT